MKKALLFAIVLLGCKSRPDVHAEADAAPARDASVAAAAASSSPAPAAKTSCLHVDEDEAKAGITTLEGTVSGGEHSHPNGSMFKFYTLELAKPMCVVGSDEEKETKEVQIFSSNAKLPINDKLMGKKVTLTGTAFPQQTAWHVRPIVVDVKTLTPR